MISSSVDSAPFTRCTDETDDVVRAQCPSIAGNFRFMFHLSWIPGAVVSLGVRMLSSHADLSTTSPPARSTANLSNSSAAPNTERPSKARRRPIIRPPNRIGSTAGLRPPRTWLIELQFGSSSRGIRSSGRLVSVFLPTKMFFFI